MAKVFDRYRRIIMVLADLCLVNVSLLLSFMILFEGSIPELMWYSCFYFMGWTSLIRIAMFSFYGIYRWSFRYASLSEAVSVVWAIALGSLELIAAAFFSKTLSIPHVISPRGMLEESALRRSAWKKAIAKYCYVLKNLKAAEYKSSFAQNHSSKTLY